MSGFFFCYEDFGRNRTPNINKNKWGALPSDHNLTVAFACLVLFWLYISFFLAIEKSLNQTCLSPLAAKRSFCFLISVKANGISIRYTVYLLKYNPTSVRLHRHHVYTAQMHSHVSVNSFRYLSL